MKGHKNKIAILIFTLSIVMASCSLLHKKTPEDYVESAKKYYDKKDYIKSYKQYSKAISLNAFFYPAYWGRANAEIALDSLERAIDDMSMYIGNISDQKILQEAYYRRGIIMDKQGYKSDACDDFKNSCNLNFNKACDIYRLKCK